MVGIERDCAFRAYNFDMIFQLFVHIILNCFFRTAEDHPQIACAADKGEFFSRQHPGRWGRHLGIEVEPGQARLPDEAKSVRGIAAYMQYQRAGDAAA